MTAINSLENVKRNLAELNGRIANAARQANRAASEIRLIGVCKRQPIAAIKAAVECGLKDLGHNYVQELAQQKSELGATFEKATWHFVGKLQSNKVKGLLQLFGTKPPFIHTLDRSSLLRVIEKEAAQLNFAEPVPCLIQILSPSLSNPKERAGCPFSEVAQLLQEVKQCPHVAVRGFMILPDLNDDPRQVFNDVVHNALGLAAEIKRLACERISLHEYSMGMTDDFEHAILAGATMIRIGTGIFGARIA